MPLHDDLRARFGGDLHINEPVAKHTSARIGGPADFLVVARTTDALRDAASLAWHHDAPLHVLGGGSNVLISDGGIRGVTLINKADSLTLTGESLVTAGSGLSSIKLARWCAARGLAGFEWAIGVPGTLGGAVVGNAGAHGGDMSDSVLSVKAAVPGDTRTVQWANAELAFAYRSSAIKREGWPCAILEVQLRFTPGDTAAIKERMATFTAHRKRTQPPGATIGSMFKNPPGDYAGRLIEAAGLKGARRGGAVISQKHANFFLNEAGATAADVMALAHLAQHRVSEAFGVRLELEIEPVGDWSL
jgi:UDP-N-acetylmuramate dehydrogenase